MKAEIISVGNELLMGDVVNTNTAFLSRQLSQMGFNVHRQLVVGDNVKDIIEATKLSVSRSHVTIFTGGLGPTKDDLTKETVAKAFGLKLVKSQAVEDSIRQFFEQKNIPMTQNNLKQAMVIEGSKILRNDNGTAPGMYIQSKKQVIVLLPGPPCELEPMFEKELKPRLEKFADVRAAHASLHVFGIGESELETLIKDLLYAQNPHAALYAKTGEVQITITSRGKSVQGANELLAKQVALIKERVGEYIYSEDGSELNETVVNILEKANVRITLAESCTGGLMASRITAVSGASKIFELGYSSYSDRAKESALSIDSAIVRKYSSVSSVVAAEMAKGALLKAKAGIAVAITGIAGPTNEGFMDKPVGLVYIAVADKNKVLVKKFNFGNMRGRGNVRELCVLNAFDMVRRFVTGLPIEGVRQFSAKDLADIEREGKPKKKSSIAIEKGVVSMLCATLILSGMYYSYGAIKAKMDKNIYDQLKTSFSSEALSEKLSSLVARNADTVGWLSVDGSTLDCVVVKNRADDFYKKHDFEGSSNKLGCPYVAQDLDLTTLPKNLVVQGKASDTSQLFNTIRAYTEPKIVQNNYLIWFDSITGSGEYKIASVFLANTNEALGNVQTSHLNASFDTTEAFQDFVVDIKMRSLFNIETEIRSDDSFLTLVSEIPDWSGANVVIVARRVRDGEETHINLNSITQNHAALYPEVYYEKMGTTSVVNEVIERDKWINWLVANDKNAANPSGSQPGMSGGIIISEGTTGNSSTVDGQTVITVNMGGKEVSDSPINIVSKIVAAEMSAAYDDEAIKAQAVATISWLKHSYNSTGSPAVSGVNPTKRLVDLVTSVINEAMYYNDAIAFTPYFDISAGKTNPSEEVFGTAYPYLVSVESRYDYQATGYNRETTFSIEALKSRLESTYGIALSKNTENWIKILSETAGGYAAQVSIDGQKTVTGFEIMQTLSIRSNCFTVTITPTQVVFKTLGSGHGVGMSKAGANEYAIAQNWDYHQILEHYYPGVVFGELIW